LSENLASFAGYENLLRSLPATHETLPAKLGNQAKRALADGAIGISVPVRRRNGEVVPLSAFEEIANAVKAAGAVLAIHIDEGGDDYNDALAIMRKCGGRIFVPHALPAYAGESEVAAIVDFLKKARQYADVRLSVSPSPYRVFHLRDLLPATMRLESAKTIRKALLDAWHAKRILAALPEAFPEELSILRAPGHPFLNNASLNEFTAHYGLDDAREGLLKLFLITGGNATLLAHGRYPRAAQSLLAHSHVLIGSHAPTPPRREATFASVFTKLEQAMGPGFATRKLSGEPARFFGIKNRGEIAQGFAADLVIVRGNRARVSIVNGKVAWFEGAHSGVRAGEPITRRR
jgi:N-acyl-D-aspartate/D-glutamate deacylase